MRNRGIATSVAVAILVGVFGVPASASAESIVGVVVDPAGRALADCRVEAEGATGQGGYGMSNSSDAGAFQIDGLQPGSYSVSSGVCGLDNQTHPLYYPSALNEVPVTVTAGVTTNMGQLQIGPIAATQALGVTGGIGKLQPKTVLRKLATIGSVAFDFRADENLESYGNDPGFFSMLQIGGRMVGTANGVEMQDPSISCKEQSELTYAPLLSSVALTYDPATGVATSVTKNCKQRRYEPRSYKRGAYRSDFSVAINAIGSTAAQRAGVSAQSVGTTAKVTADEIARVIRDPKPDVQYEYPKATISYERVPGRSVKKIILKTPKSGPQKPTVKVVYY